METVALSVQLRDKSQKISDLRKNRFIPIEYYGKGVENKSLQADYQSFVKAFRKAGESTIIELDIDGKKTNVLIHEIQYDPITDEFMHVDVINVKMGEEIHTNIPLNFTGVAPAVKELGGTLMSQLDQLEVKCLPKDLVHDFEVNVDSLVDFNVAIHVKDVVVPAGVTVLNDPDQIVIAVVAPRVEKETEESEMPETEVAADSAEKSE